MYAAFGAIAFLAVHVEQESDTVEPFSEEEIEERLLGPFPYQIMSA